MKLFLKFSFCFLLISSPLSSWSVELVCSGYNTSNDSQRKVVVNCNDRQQVLGFLQAGFLLLREKQMPSYMEDMCWEPYKSIKEYPPEMFSGDMASTFFQQCNASLKSID